VTGDDLEVWFREGGKISVKGIQKNTIKPEK
jgi:hypothetical protein